MLKNAFRAVTLSFIFTLILGVGLAMAAPAAPKAGEQRTVTAQEAVKILTEQADKGDGQAMLSLGSLYENGLGVSRNYTKAFEWYKKSADAKQAEGWYNMGVCYEIGMGVAANGGEALKAFKKAADMKLPQAFYKLSSVYLEGNLVKPNNKEAMYYLTRAQEAGHALAANELGVIYLNGALDQKVDGKRAVDMFGRSANLGNPEAMKNLAVVYKDGLGQQGKDPVKALKWYLIAKEFGYQTNDIDDIIASVKKDMKDEDVKAGEAEYQKWVEDFKAKAKK